MIKHWCTLFGSVFAFIYKRVKVFGDFFLTAFLSRPLQGIDIGSNSVWPDRPYTPLSTLNGSIWRFPSYSLPSALFIRCIFVLCLYLQNFDNNRRNSVTRNGFDNSFKVIIYISIKKDRIKAGQRKLK